MIYPLYCARLGRGDNCRGEPSRTKRHDPNCREFASWLGRQNLLAKQSSAGLWGFDAKKYSCSKEGKILRAGGVPEGFLKEVSIVLRLVGLILTRQKHREGNGTPLQYSYLENPMDREAW